MVELRPSGPEMVRSGRVAADVKEFDDGIAVKEGGVYQVTKFAWEAGA